MSNGMELAAIITQVEKFNADFKTALVAEQEKVKLAGEARDEEAWRFAAGLLDLALALDPETPSVALIEFLKQRGQRVAKDGDNQYVPFVKAVVAVKDGDKWKFNPKEASFAKYANIVRQLVENKRLGKISGSIVDHIRNYEWETPSGSTKRKLGALEAQDRFERPNASATKRVDDLRRDGLNAKPVETLDSSLGYNDGDVVILWGVVRGGKLEVMKQNVGNDMADTLYYQLGKELKAA